MIETLAMQMEALPKLKPVALESAASFDSPADIWKHALICRSFGEPTTR